MRTVPLSSRVRSISRGKNGSAIASAAYQAGYAIDSELEGKLHDYRRKRGVEATEIVVPAGALHWAMDPGQLWNAAELRETNKDPRAKSKLKAKATTARTFFFGLAHELSPAGRLHVSRRAAQWVCDKSRVAVQFSIHEPGREGDHRNWHCHMIWTSRRVTPKGLGEKTREWDTKGSASTLCRELRAFIAGAINEQLAAEDKAAAVFVEHRSFKAQGSSQKPTWHQGVTRTNIRRKEQRLARNAWQKAATENQATHQHEELARLTDRQQAALRAKLDHLAEQERSGVETIRADLARDHAADRQATGMRRVFEVATGRAGRDDLAKAERAADRERLAERTTEEFRKGMQAERAAYARMQQQEAKEIADRHLGENRQLGQALSARIAADRLAEVQARREQVNVHEHARRQGPELTR